MPTEVLGDSPLNPALFCALAARFGKVRISNAGQSVRLIPQVVWRRGHPFRRTTLSKGGEHYAVCCAFCGDTRYRLSVHYLWGTSDPATGSPMLHLAHCFNEDCMSSPAARRDLFSLVFPRGKHVRIAHERLKSQPVRATPPELQPALPENFVPLSDPSCPDAVLDYVSGRGFDPAVLADRWGVGYSRSSTAPPPRFAWRLVIPVYDVVRPLPLGKVPEQTLVGWQARRMDGGDSKSDPKYLTCAGMPKSRILYGLPQALETTAGPIVVVEGVTDVWRLGTHAVAMFGKDLSQLQRRLLAHFHGHPLVMFLDRGAEAEAVAIQDALLRERKLLADTAPVVVAHPPHGRDDVGECTTEEAWRAVARALGLRLTSLRKQLEMRGA